MFIQINLRPGVRRKPNRWAWVKPTLQIGITLLLASALVFVIYEASTYVPTETPVVQVEEPVRTYPEDDLDRIVLRHDKTICYRDHITRTMSCVYNPNVR